MNLTNEQRAAIARWMGWEITARGIGGMWQTVDGSHWMERVDEWLAPPHRVRHSMMILDRMIALGLDPRLGPGTDAPWVLTVRTSAESFCGTLADAVIAAALACATERETL